MKTSSQKVYQSLKDSRHFKSMPDEIFSRFVKSAKIHEFKNDEIVIKQGELNKTIYIIVSGKASVIVDDKLIYVLKRYGDVVGEISALSEKPAKVTFCADGKLSSIGVSSTFFKDLDDDSSHELRFHFYKWLSEITAEKLELAYQTAKMHEDAQTTIHLKNQELKKRVNDLKSANDNLLKTQIELAESNKVAALTKTFRKFVPEEFLNRISQNGIENIEVGKAESEFVTVLFTDIRDFTALAEKMTPQEIFKFLNSYLERMNVPIHRYGGFIDKFIGDAIMAIFNHPEGSDEEEAQNAIKASIGLKHALKVYNQHRKKCGYPPIRFGIGIHSGPVMMGTIGSSTRMEFTIIGDAVNLASRIEGLTKFYEVDIIISQETYKLLKLSAFEVRELDVVRVKGKEQEVVILELFSELEPEKYEKRHQMLPVYYQGLSHFRIQLWDEAIHFFEEALKIYPQDRPSQIYLDRCLYHLENPPEKGWNYVYQLAKH